MLYVRDGDGVYRPAERQQVFSEANRLSGYRLRRRTKISSSSDAGDAIGYRLRDRQCEVFACLFLDSGHRVLAFREMFRGSINRATVHPREVVKEALYLNAAAVILAHNHPSGESTPSGEDVNLTGRLEKALRLIDIRVLDHLVIGETIFSFADAGMIGNP